jgi:hypothetical protein
MNYLITINKIQSESFFVPVSVFYKLIEVVISKLKLHNFIIVNIK